MECFTAEAVIGGTIAALIVLGVLLILWALSAVETWSEYKNTSNGQDDSGTDEG